MRLVHNKISALLSRLLKTGCELGRHHTWLDGLLCAPGLVKFLLQPFRFLKGTALVMCL